MRIIQCLYQWSLPKKYQKDHMFHIIYKYFQTRKGRENIGKVHFCFYTVFFYCLWVKKLLPCLFIVLCLAFLVLNSSYTHSLMYFCTIQCYNKKKSHSYEQIIHLLTAKSINSAPECSSTLSYIWSDPEGWRRVLAPSSIRL